MKKSQLNNKRLLIKIVADNTNKKVCYTFILFFILTFSMMYLLTIFIVPNTFVYLQGIEKCTQIKEFKGLCHQIEFSETLTWISIINKVNKKNQFLVIFGKFLRNIDSPEMNIELGYDLEIMPVDEFGENKEESEFYKKMKQDKINIYCEDKNFECRKKVFILYPQIDHEQYKIIVKFELNDNLRKISKGLKLEIMTVSETYTSFLIALRYTFLVISFISGLLYFIYFLKIPKNLRTFEHKYIAFLSISLFFFNDPFYAATILEANIFLAVLSTLFVVQFLTLLILFWIIMVQRIHKENVRIGTKFFNKINISLCLIGFCFLMITSIIASIYLRFDPGFHANAEYPTVYNIFQIILIFYMLILLVVLFINIYKICKSWKLIIQRHKVFMKISIFFIFGLFILGITGIYQSYNSDGIKVFLLFFLSNFYIYLLQILWFFTKDKNYDEYFKTHKEEDYDNYEYKKQKGFNYFDDNSEINIIRKSEDKESIDDQNKYLEKNEGINFDTEDDKDEIDRKKFLSIQNKFDQEDNKDDFERKSDL